MSEANQIEQPVVPHIVIGAVGMQLEQIKRLLESGLIEMEIGAIDRFVIHKSPEPEQIGAYAIPNLAQITHGPQRKGRGGKVRRW